MTENVEKLAYIYWTVQNTVELVKRLSFKGLLDDASVIERIQKLKARYQLEESVEQLLDKGYLRECKIVCAFTKKPCG